MILKITREIRGKLLDLLRKWQEIRSVEGWLFQNRTNSDFDNAAVLEADGKLRALRQEFESQAREICSMLFKGGAL